MTIVRLHGMLGKEFGESWKLEVRSIRQAIKLLEVNTKGFFKYLIDKDKEGVSYRLLINGKDHRCDEDLILVRELETIDIIPIPQGSGMGGLFKILIGIVIIAAVVVASIFTFGGAAAAFTAIAAGTGLTAGLLGAALVFGASLVLGGLFELVSGSPKAKGGSTVSDQKNSEQPAPSYIFAGPVNTIRQGNPIPIGYGLLRVGSQVISSGITTRNVGV